MNRRFALPFALAAVLAAAGCSSPAPIDPNSTQAVEKLYAEAKDEMANGGWDRATAAAWAGEPLRVVASVPELGAIARAVGGGLGQEVEVAERVAGLTLGDRAEEGGDVGAVASSIFATFSRPPVVVLPEPPLKFTTAMTWRCSPGRRWRR